MTCHFRAQVADPDCRQAFFALKKCFDENELVKNNFDATTAPTANDDAGDGYSVGSVWIDLTTDAAYVLTDATTGAANWVLIGPASGSGPANAEYLVGALHAGLSAERLVTNTTSNIWDLTTGGQAKVERAALTGDATASQNSNALTLATVNANVGSFGTATQVGTFTVNAKGLITAASNTAISVTLDSLSDVAITGHTLGDYLRDNGTNYVDVTIAQILTDLLTVDGAGSGLDADLLDGISSAAFGLVANPLSQFAATTSAQLAGIITNETGTGLLVFNDTPTLIAPLLGTPTSGLLTNCTGLPIVAGTTGTLSVARGGTGVTTIADVSILVANATDVLSVLTPGAGQSIRVNAGATDWEAYTPGGGSGHTIRENGTDLTARTGLNFIDTDTGNLHITDDAGGDETEVNMMLYTLLAGRSGGQIIRGGTGASETLILESTFNATKGTVRSRDNFIIGNAVAATDYTLTFDGETNDGLLTWMEDEDYFAFNDDILMNSTERIYFLDTTSSIRATSAGNVTLDAATLLTLGVNGDTSFGDGTSVVGVYPHVTLKGDLGSSTKHWRDLYVGGSIYSAGDRVGYNLTVYAAGTAYALTNSAAALNFGTTDPALTLDKAGTYLLSARCQLKYNAATFAANRTTTIKLRRTNNTAADLTSGSVTATTRIITTITDTFVDQCWQVIYTTANTNDIIEMFGSIDVVPTAGSCDAVAAHIVAVRLY